METPVFGDIVACLPRGRTLFWYERDRFAVQLVTYLLQAGWSAKQLRASRFARLLDKPAIRDLLAARGSLELDLADLALAAPREPLPFRLTIGRWGEADTRKPAQATRRGVNIVLQLNMANDHREKLRQRFRFDCETMFNYRAHPVSTSEHTLAWARIDIDLESGEALIEEVQSDWVRFARRAMRNPLAYFNRRIKAHVADDRRLRWRFKWGVRDYVRVELPPYEELWEEAMLSAALFFIVEELGLKRVFMHQYESGNRLKGLTGDAKLPPRSLYTDLPRKFCFERSREIPRLVTQALERPRKVRKIVKRKLQQAPLAFWLLDLGKKARA